MFDNRRSTEEIALLARECLPLKGKAKDNKYECPICGGNLYVSKNNNKVTCLDQKHPGELFKAILGVAGEWDKDREEWKQERERENLAKKANKKVVTPISITEITLVPGNLIEKDYTEFAGSAIDRATADLNYTRLEDRLLISKVLNRSGWKGPGGYYCGGINLATGKPGYLGQFKPDHLVKTKEEKKAKYFTRSGDNGYDAIAPIHPSVDWDKVVSDVNIPVFLTEGTKKAISYMVNKGQPAIALPGVDMFRYSDGNLVPNLEILAKPGRVFFIGYDSDKNEKAGVASALVRVSERLINQGCQVIVVDWDAKYKGIDDYFVNVPAESRYLELIPFSEWQKQQRLKVKTADGVVIELPEPPKLTYQGETLTITDRFDLLAPAVLRVPSFNKDDAGKLIDQVESYHRLACQRFSHLPMDVLRIVAKENNIKQSLNKSEAVNKIINYLKITGEELEGKTSEQLKEYAKEKGIKNLFGLTAYELAERLEKANIDKSGLTFKENLTLTIKIDHPAGGFIASVLEGLNDLDNPKYDILLPFDLIKKGQYIAHRKATRNDPKEMVFSLTFENWKRARKFTPDKITHAKYLTESDLLRNIDLTDGQVHAILAGLGTGKTTLMIELTKSVQEKAKAVAERYPDHHVMIISYRNGLVFNTVEKMQQTGLPMQDGKEFKNNTSYVKKGDTAWVGACFDSFLTIDQIMHKDWEKKAIFIFDECDSVVNHILFSSTVKDKRIASIKRLIECLKASAGVLALSGTLNDTCLKFFSGIKKEINGEKVTIGGIGKNLIKYQNIIDRRKIPVRWILGSSDDIETDILQIKEKDYYKIVDNIVGKLKRGKRVIISADSQKQCERIHKYLNKIFKGHNKKNIVRIDRKTRSKDESSPFIDSILRNPKLLPEIGCDVLIYNSSAESGVDISFDEIHHNYFSHQFHFGYGVVSIDSNIQLLRRYRHGCPLTIWMAPTSNNKPALLQGKDLEFDRRTRMIESGLTKETQPDDYICELADELAYNLAYEQSNLRQCMLQALTEHGYEIEFICEGETDTTLSEETKEIEDENANDIFDADPKFIDADTSDLKKEDEQSYDNQMALSKAYYFSNFGYTREDHDNNKHELFTVENIIEIEKYNGSFFDKVRNHIFIDLSKEDLKLLQRKKYSGEFSTPIFYRDVKRVVLPLTAIKRSGMTELLTMKKVATDHQIFGKIRKYAKKHPYQWKSLCDSEYSEKWFFSQVKSILDRNFGVTIKREKDQITIGCSDLITASVAKIKGKTLEKLEKIKQQQLDELVVELVETEVVLEDETKLDEGIEVLVEVVEDSQPVTPAPQPTPIYAIAGEYTTKLVNPWDLININGVHYLLGKIVEINQQLPDNYQIVINKPLPSYLGGRIGYKDIVFVATKYINGVIQFVNDHNYWVIDYYPEIGQIKYYNTL